MFVFSLDASDQVERAVEEEYTFSDCHLYCLCYIFFDIENVDGSLYVVEKAICTVTSSPQYLPLMSEMINSNIRLIKNDRSIQLSQLLESQIENSTADDFSNEI